MLNSMTGFGTGSVNDGETHVRVELKSVNHRFFDLSFNGPRPLLYMEDKIKKAIRQYVRRGALSVFISIDGSKAIAPRLQTNWAIVDQYIEAVSEIQKRSGGHDWDFSRVLMLPGVFTLQEAGSQSAIELEPLILQALEKACNQLMRMRRAEGDQLKQDLEKKLDFIERQVFELTAMAPQVHANYEKRLRQHVADFLGNHQFMDEQRLMNEVAVFSDKSSIDEELTRMSSHLSQFRTLLEEKRPAGRQLDFLIQEMNREINTIGSKGNSAEMSRKVVSVKSEIEKLREQVQNVE
ncbi:YicC family protein [Sporolactobacillus sp. THM7-4]|nr:YicC family protein [Sporolactobacillus sp. THM7-4]